MRRKRLLRLITLFIGLLCIPISQAEATAPTAIDLSYDYDTQILQFFVHHLVDDPSEHYIQYVIILRNGEFYRSISYSRQTSFLGLEDSVRVPAVAGDVINVTALCIMRYWYRNSYLSAEIMVEGPTTSTTTTKSSMTETTYTTTITTVTTPNYPKTNQNISNQNTEVSIIPFMLGSIFGLMTILYVLERNEDIS